MGACQNILMRSNATAVLFSWRCKLHTAYVCNFSDCNSVPPRSKFRVIRDEVYKVEIGREDHYQSLAR